MRPPAVNRRRLLHAIGTLSGVGLAGCQGTPSNEGGSPTESVPGPTTTSTEPTPSPTEPVPSTTSTESPSPQPTSPTRTPSKHVAIGIQNDSEHDPTVTLTIRDGSEDDVLFREEYDVGPGIRYARDAEAAISVPGTYLVTATLGTGVEATYEWRVAGALGSLTVIVTAEGSLDFKQRVDCWPACSPVSRGGSAVDLPYAVDGEPETFTAADAHVKTKSEEPVLLTLDVAHRDTQLLHYTYNVTPDRELYVGGITTTAGTFEVTAQTDAGGRDEYTWEIPPDDNWPLLGVVIQPDGSPLVGCDVDRPARIHIENESAESRSVTLALARDGGVVAEASASVGASNNTVASLSIPIGGEYTVTATSAEGARVQADALFCACYADRTTVTIDEDGLGIETSRSICD